jgi:hypothetical protein
MPKMISTAFHMVGFAIAWLPVSIVYIRYYIYACIMFLMLYDVICIKIWIIVSTSSALPVIERIRAHCRSWRLRSPSIEREWADCEWIWMTPNCGCEPRPEQYSTLTGALDQFLHCWPWWSESLDHSKGFQGLGTLSRFLCTWAYGMHWCQIIFTYIH